MENKELYITAFLAQIELGEENIESFNKAVTQLLSYFSKMMELEVDDLEITTHALLKQNRTRNDHDSSNNHPDPDTLIDCSPDIEERFIVIPNVL
jgi:aspartyl-tRNA(Asn)/glutamyl-tRNA(Gln) amidotransferase subunit C